MSVQEYKDAPSMGGHLHPHREPMIVCRDAVLGYENQSVISGLNFTVQVGDYICIIGENGSGKSTLIKSLLGLIKPLSGEVQICACVKQGSIGYLPQQTRAQKNFPATVREVVLSGFLNKSGFRPFYSLAEKKQAERNMEKLGILALRDKCYRELSGGQQQRVLLARALCAANRLLILDEPVTGLDPAAATELYELLRKLNVEDNMAIVMVTHDMYHALHEPKHILHISSDHYFYGTVSEYVMSPDGARFIGHDAKSCKTCTMCAGEHGGVKR